MEITDIAVNPDNISDFDLSTSSVDLGCARVGAWLLNGKALDSCLDAHMTLNSYLSEKTGGDDAGGKYANWLNSMGFYHQSDNGWWNEIAVTPENILSFVKTYEDEKFDELVNCSIERFKRKKFNHDMTLVSEFLEVFG